MAEEAFTEHRPLLFTIAYEMLGSAPDAEDVLQESYLRWSSVDRAAVGHPPAYLVRTVTRQALNHLRAVRARREEYMGKTEVTIRQIAHRARRHVHARRRRFEPDSDDTRQIVQRFLLAATTGEVQALMDLLAPDVVQVPDGGGKVVAARRPITGRADVARFVLGVLRTTTAATRVEHATYNGMAAARFVTDGELDWLVAFEIDGGRIAGLYGVRNPDKLHRAETVLPLDRGGNQPWKP
nr:RNA polymerase subunit sigma-24 [Streptomyces sp. NBC_01001]